MRWFGISFGMAALLAGCGPSGENSALQESTATALLEEAPLVISQVYGGGSNSSAPWQSDFVEVFNRGSLARSLDGWSVQYASASGTGLFSSNLVALSGTLQPGQYYLIALAGGTVGAPLPTPDRTGKIAMSATAGKVILCSQAAGLACNGGSSPCDAAAESKIVDLVGYGSANYFESAPAPGLSNTTAALRTGSGCDDSNHNAADFAVGTPAPRNTAFPLHPCSVDVAPTVVATTPDNGAAHVSPDVMPSLQFSEPVTLDANAVAWVCNSSGAVGFALEGGPTTYTLAPAANLVLGETCTLQITGTAVHDGDTVDPPDTMAADVSFSFTVVAGPGPYRIHDIQGRAHLSPLANQTVTAVPGIVTVVRSAGFYFQDPQPDQDDMTSEGLYVYTGARPTVAVGDAVLVTGPVTEYRPSCSSCSPSSSSYANLTSTEINRPSSVAVLSRGNPLPPPVPVGAGHRQPPTEIIEAGISGDIESHPEGFDAATHGIDFYESLEGMRLGLTDAVAVGPSVLLPDGSRELAVLAEKGQGVTGRTPRGGIIIGAADYNPERIILADTLGWPLPDADVGDCLPGTLVGVVDYSSGNFKLLVSEALPPLERIGLAREVLSFSTPSAAELTLATLNAENLSPSDGAGKFTALADILVNHLKSPDLVALEEVQDNDGAVDKGVVDASQTLALLQAAIEAAGGPTYEYRQIDPENDRDGGQTGGNIRVVLFFRADRGLSFVDRPGATSTTPNEVVSEAGGPALRFSPGRIDPLNPAFANSRKPLAATFVFNGRTLFVIANHFNSKGGDQPLFGRFQPPILSSQEQRLAQAQVLAAFVGQIQAVDPAALVVALGDFNDFELSPPLQVLKAAGLNPLIETLPPAERYTYVYQGNSQALDHILVTSPWLATAQLDVVHVNAEFMSQTSDHDPSVARLAVGVAPHFTSDPPTQATQGQAYAYQAQASGTPVPSYSLDTAPPGMTVDASTGQLSWTPIEIPGSYTVVLRAHNGVSPDASQTFAVVVSAPPHVQHIQPEFECAERASDGSFVLHFGFHNPNSFKVLVPIGLANMFFPGPADRGQPAVFAPGEVHNAFQVRLSWPALLLWELQGRVALAATLPHPRCP